MKKIVFVILAVIAFSSVCSSCAKKQCDAYRSVNKYRAENIR